MAEPACIYFDNNATTHMDSVVAECMHSLNLEGTANPASQHRQGRRALHLIEAAKTDILKAVDAPWAGMDSAQVILTSGGTEANNLAVFGMLKMRPGIAIVGSTDHPSILEAAKHDRDPSEFRVLSVDQRGQFNKEQLAHWLETETVSFVSLMLGNNETGIIQDLKTICEMCRPYGVPVHSDIVQAIGKIPVSFRELGLSAATLTGHKIHGPVGVGALIVDSELKLEPVMIGGGQQLGLRAGTEPVVPAVGLACSLREIIGALEAGEFEKVLKLRDEFEQLALGLENVQVVGADAPRLPHTSNLSFIGADRQALHMALDLAGLACSTGSACSSGSSRPSGSLVAMQLPDDVVRGSLRFSLSRFSTHKEVNQAFSILSEALNRCVSTTN